ncbi:hypothetical protein H0H92_004518, partial [Tricholoma furcatifolium]
MDVLSDSRSFNPESASVAGDDETLNEKFPPPDTSMRSASVEDDRRLVKCNASNARRLLDSFQQILDTPDLNPSFRKRLIVAIQRIATTSGLYPTCYELKDVVAQDEYPVDSGGFADIFKGTYRGKTVCLKTFRLTQATQIDYALKQMSREVLLWGQLEHPNITTIYGVFRFRSRICIVSPWMDNGHICSYLIANPQAPRLLLPNVLVDGAGRARLADFGLSSVTESNIAAWTSQTRGTSKGGTIRWQAPELFNAFGDSHPVNTVESDIYAWGCVLFEIFTGKIPFHHINNDYAVVANVTSGGRPLRPDSLDPVPWLTRDVWALMERCWKESPSERPSIAEITIWLSTKINKEDTRPLAEDGHSPSEFRRHMGNYGQIIDTEFLDQILSPSFNEEPADEKEWVAQDVIESNSVKGNEFFIAAKDLLKEYFHRIDNLFGGKQFAYLIGDIAFHEELKDKLQEYQARKENSLKQLSEISEIWRTGRTHAPQLRTQRKERVKRLAQNLVYKLETFTESATASNEPELSKYWREICEHEANELKGQSYGAELLRAIGHVYVRKAKQFLASKSTRFGIGGLIHSAKNNSRVVNDVILSSGLIYRVGYANVDAEHDESPEEIVRLKKRWFEIGLKSWFHIVKLEIESILRDACDKVLEEKNITPEKARLRAVALQSLGDAFMAVSEDGSPQ